MCQHVTCGLMIDLSSIMEVMMATFLLSLFLSQTIDNWPDGIGTSCWYYSAINTSSTLCLFLVVWCMGVTQQFPYLGAVPGYAYALCLMCSVSHLMVTIHSQCMDPMQGLPWLQSRIDGDACPFLPKDSGMTRAWECGGQIIGHGLLISIRHGRCTDQWR